MAKAHEPSIITDGALLVRTKKLEELKTLMVKKPEELKRPARVKTLKEYKTSVEELFKQI